MTCIHMQHILNFTFMSYLTILNSSNPIVVPPDNNIRFQNQQKYVAYFEILWLRCPSMQCSRFSHNLQFIMSLSFIVLSIYRIF